MTVAQHLTLSAGRIAAGRNDLARAHAGSCFKLALTRVIEPTRGPGAELATLEDAARFVGLMKPWRQARVHWDFAVTRYNHPKKPPSGDRVLVAVMAPKGPIKPIFAKADNSKAFNDIIDIVPQPPLLRGITRIENRQFKWIIGVRESGDLQTALFDVRYRVARLAEMINAHEAIGWWRCRRCAGTGAWITSINPL